LFYENTINPTKKHDKPWENPLEIFVASSVEEKFPEGDDFHPLVIELGVNTNHSTLNSSVPELELVRALSDSLTKAQTSGREVFRACNRLFTDLQPNVLKSLWINCVDKDGITTVIRFKENSIIDWSKLKDLSENPSDISIESAYYYDANNSEPGRVTEIVKDLWAKHLAYVEDACAPTSPSESQSAADAAANSSALTSTEANTFSLPKDCFYDPFSSASLIDSPIKIFYFDKEASEKPVFNLKHATGVLLTLISLSCDKQLKRSPRSVIKTCSDGAVANSANRDSTYSFVSQPPNFISFEADQTTLLLVDALIDIFTDELAGVQKKRAGKVW